jgi:hypothetical protein
MNEQPAGDEGQTHSMPNTPQLSGSAAAENAFGDAHPNANSIVNTTSNMRISPRMREEDADLLESMHYASSQVSQYTPDGTPVLRPKDRSLPMEDFPLISMPIVSTSELVMKKGDGSDKYKTPMKEGRVIDRSGWSSGPLQQQQEENSASEKGTNLAMPELPSSNTKYVSQSSIQHSTMAKHSEYSKNSPTKLSVPQQLHSRDGGVVCGVIRRLLSGEVRSVSGGERGENDIARPQHETSNRNQQPASRTNALEEENYETDRREDWEPNLSPVSVTQVSTTKTEQDGMAQLRRVSEAIQFAQAVGEEIALNRDDLCIIDDDTEDEDDDDDDDDDENGDNTESKERVALNTSIHESVLSPDYLMIPITPKKIDQALLADHETPLTKRSIVHSPKLNHRRKARPMWPFTHHSDMEFSFMNHLSDGTGDRSDFVYKGICANPPEITKRGIQRGNYAQLHRKAWLEVSDKYHRYGKNLRLYYRFWERLGFPTNQFFEWLDSKGEAAGQPLPNIEEIPRSVLDSDTVLYITNPNVSERYALNIVVGDDGRGLVVDVDEDPVHTGPDGWIFILRDNVMYGAPKITSVTGHSKQRFHHSSFFCGKAVASAGIIITDNQGYLTRLYPHSGHYRPGEAHMQRMLFFLHRKGVDLRTFEMDTQQLSHVSREKEDPKKKSGKGKMGHSSGDGKSSKGKEEKKVKKVDSLHLEKAVDVACFLAHKADFIGNGLFDKIHKIRKADVTSVSEALDLVNGDEHSRTTNVGK